MRNRIVSVSVAVALMLGVGLVGCATEYEPEITKHTLTISSTEGGDSSCVPAVGCTCGEGTESGDGLTVPAECLCVEGTEVNIEAVPNTGYRFAGWTGDLETAANADAAKTTITMNGDCFITANFVKQYDLTISSTAGGSVTTPGEGIYTYDEGEIVNLVAKAAKGYRFANWSGGAGTIADVSSASTTITMDGNYSVTATFEAQEEEEQPRRMFSEGSLHRLVRDGEPAEISGSWRFEFAWEPDIYGLVHLTVSAPDEADVRLENTGSRCGYGPTAFAYAGEMLLTSGNLEVLGLEQNIAPHREGPSVFVYATGDNEGGRFRAGICSWSEDNEVAFWEYFYLPREETGGLIEELIDQSLTQVMGDVEEFVRISG